METIEVTNDVSAVEAVTPDQAAHPQADNTQSHNESTPVDTPAPAQTAPPSEAEKPKKPAPLLKESRAVPRKLFSGRAKVAYDKFSWPGRVLDLSLHGFSAIFDDPIRVGTSCSVSCDIFSAGITHHFVSSALAIQSVLVSGKGFRVGFQFQRLSDSSREVIQQLVKAP